MIPTIGRVIRHRNGAFLRPCTNGFELVDSWRAAGRWTQDNAEKLLPMLPAFYVNPAHLTIVDAPACGCCGNHHPPALRESEDRWGFEVLRCERHHLRRPCTVTGCGRTFRMTLFDSYEGEVMCSAHWRMAPRYMRDAAARVRRIGKRRDWPDAIRNRHHRLWRRIVRAVHQRGDVGGDGHIDVDAIHAMFGFDEDEE